MARSQAEKALSLFVQIADNSVLQCRTGRHRFPYLDDEGTKATRPRALSGSYLVEGYCPNGCGTHSWKVVAPSGYLEDSGVSRYVYDKKYRLPAEAAEIDRRDVTAACRLELLNRRSER